MDWSLGHLNSAIGNVSGAVFVSEATVVWIMNGEQEAEGNVQVKCKGDGDGDGEGEGGGDGDEFDVL